VLVDPHSVRHVPGRKTDVLDCQWLQQLHTYGLLRGAFRPEASVRSLRVLCRHRADLVCEGASHCCRLISERTFGAISIVLILAS
jgi:transposase